MSGAISLLPNTPSWRDAQLKYRDNFTFYLLAELVLASQEEFCSLEFSELVS
jgi:hypothetical protein